jgi:hypothetical protein
MNATKEQHDDSRAPLDLTGNPQEAAADTRDVVDVVNVVTSPGKYVVDSQAAAALEAIQAADAPNRFLQHWNPQAHTLTFGFGNGTTGVTVCSNREIKAATSGVGRTRMRPSHEMLEQWFDAPAPSGKSLLGKIAAIFVSYLYFADPRHYTLLPLWTLGTYVYSIFTHYGYLHLFSPTPRCGKTRGQELVHHLAFEATQPLNAPTPPVIRDYAAEGGTVQLDTLERWPEKNRESFSAAMELLDAGFRSGGTVSIKVPKQKQGWRTEILDVFAPYTMAGVHKNSLSDTALDRAFSIEMKRKDIGTLKPYHSDRCAQECAPLREESYAWALQNADALATFYESDELDRRVRHLALSDRAADIWKPLLAIAAIAGADRDQIEALEGLAVKMNADPEAAQNTRRIALVRALRKHTGDEECALMTNQIVELLKHEGVPVTDSEVSSQLRAWQIEQKSVRLGAEAAPRRCWILNASVLGNIEDQLQGGPQVICSTPDSSEEISPENPDYIDYGDYTDGESSIECAADIRSETEIDHMTLELGAMNERVTSDLLGDLSDEPRG